MKRILILEPYFGGSHKNFIRGLMKTVDAEYTLFSLPARKWKMRMQLSSPFFVEKVRELDEKRFDTVLCSTFVDVATLRALLQHDLGWSEQTVFCTYFHENQFAYPSRVADSSLHQFSAMNFTSALSSDRLAFNSLFNYRSFMEGISCYLNKAVDMRLSDAVPQIGMKSTILHPGVDFDGFPEHSSTRTGAVPVICWNHRWEHDKNPEEFFSALFQLQEDGIPFQLRILGQSFTHRPPIFEKALKRCGDNIVQFGYVKSRQEYIRHLCQSDIIVSTAVHEFFGMAVIEAVRCGCYPLLPNRLSYPELFEARYLYDEGTLEERLKEVLQQMTTGSLNHDIDTERYSWNNLKENYTAWLLGGGGNNHSGLQQRRRPGENIVKSGDSHVE